MTGDEFKESILSLFRITWIEETLEHRSRNGRTKVVEIEKILQLYDQVQDIPDNKYIIYYTGDLNEEVAEVAVSEDLYPRRIFNDEEQNNKIEDNENKIRYEIMEEISDYYLVWLYKQLFDKYPISMRKESIRRMYRILYNRGSKVNFRTKEEATETPLLDIMRKAIYCTTLKVTKQIGTKINLEDAIDSFSYTYMCNLNKPIKVYSLEEIIGVPNRRQRVQNNDFEAPKRKYNSNLIDYYNLAISSEDPFVSFISYYHIIEYFFDEVFREQQINTLRTSITTPRFSYKDDEQLFNIIEKIIKDNRFFRENGSGNEHQSLNYVLNKFIYDLDDFKQRLDIEELDFYKNNIVSFSKGDVINWDKDKDKVLKAISNRIYKTRNALIHNKSSKKDVTYHPYLHKAELDKENSLIKAIAECIIENDSEYLM